MDVFNAATRSFNLNGYTGGASRLSYLAARKFDIDEEDEVVTIAKFDPVSVEVERSMVEESKGEAVEPVTTEQVLDHGEAVVQQDEGDVKVGAVVENEDTTTSQQRLVNCFNQFSESMKSIVFGYYSRLDSQLESIEQKDVSLQKLSVKVHNKAERLQKRRLETLNQVQTFWSKFQKVATEIHLPEESVEPPSSEPLEGELAYKDHIDSAHQSDSAGDNDDDPYQRRFRAHRERLRKAAAEQDDDIHQSDLIRSKYHTSSGDRRQGKPSTSSSHPHSSSRRHSTTRNSGGGGGSVGGERHPTSTSSKRVKHGNQSATVHHHAPASPAGPASMSTTRHHMRASSGSSRESSRGHISSRDREKRGTSSAATTLPASPSSVGQAPVSLSQGTLAAHRSHISARSTPSLPVGSQ